MKRRLPQLKPCSRDDAQLPVGVSRPVTLTSALFIYLATPAAFLSFSQAADRPPQPGIAEPGRDFESVELEAEQHQQQREKIPRRIIHFSSGETMEEYSTDEEEDEEEVKMAERKDLLSSSADAVRVRMG